MKPRKIIRIIGGVLLIGGTVTVAHALESIENPGVTSAGGEFLPALVFPKESAVAQIISRPKIGQIIATLEIPRLNRVIDVFEGTQKAQLSQGAGHYIRSVLPGYRDNSVIAGHRDSVFSQFGSLKKGDKLHVSTSYGNFTYTIVSLKIVDAKDKTVIVPTTHSRLTLSTCYPFRYIGNAPQRFIVGAVLTSRS
jgi:sortase A